MFMRQIKRASTANSVPKGLVKSLMLSTIMQMKRSSLVAILIGSLRNHGGDGKDNVG